MWDKSCNISKIVSVLLSTSVEWFFLSPVCGIFLLLLLSAHRKKLSVSDPIIRIFSVHCSKLHSFVWKDFQVYMYSCSPNRIFLILANKAGRGAPDPLIFGWQHMRTVPNRLIVYHDFKSYLSFFCIIPYAWHIFTSKK